ncbi:aldo/keto reductase [uncultured Arcticibacterium sp.]|uniref:aldo/keto reductase n=1 Tax=uncultured Arcticibacterium sp. TaxID=2173042 RepID=UPI0030F9676A
MKYLELSNKDKMPVLGLGTWKAAPGDVYKAVRTAITLGYTHFDCAHVYGNEKEIGEAFADSFKAGEAKREDLWITSKLWNNSHRTEQIEPALKLTLANLQLDYLDLYLIHWPVVLKDTSMYPETAADMVSLSVTPLEETWKGMIAMKEAGLAKHIGVSNFSPSKMDGIIEKTGVTPEVNQVEMHLFLQQNELKSYCDEKNIILTAYAPLGSADRPAVRKSADEPKLFENEVIKEIAKEKDCSTAQVMLAWAVVRGTTVIPKSVNESRLAENLAAADIELSNTQMKALNDLNQDFRFIKGDFWCIEGSDYTFDSLWG